MKITNAEVFLTCPGRNFVILKIETDQGVVGYGDGTLNGREKPVVSCLQDCVIPMLIGMDPRRIEDVWQLLYRGAYWRGGPVAMSAIAAVDLALWDIKGKMAGMPVYDLLGGRSREKLQLYGHAAGRDIAATIDAVSAWIEQGYRTVRAQTGVPGLNTIYGVQSSSNPGIGSAPPRADLPPVHQWDSDAYLKVVPELFEQLALTFGDQARFLHDTHHRLRPIEAARLAKELEPFHLFWLEDVCRPELAERFRLIRSASTTPLALGEVFHTIQECQPYIEEGLIDFIRVAAIHAGGITHTRRIIDFSALHDVRIGLHGPPDVSPIGMAAQVHLGAWAPNFGVQEWAVFPASEMDDVFRHEHWIERGHVIPSEASGLGVTFNETNAKKHEFKRSYLGVNRLMDGTVWNY
ncbi:MAG: D-mannonate dehydratase ManD [Geminicoccaceae bacterium]